MFVMNKTISIDKKKGLRGVDKNFRFSVNKRLLELFFNLISNSSDPSLYFLHDELQNQFFANKIF